MRIRLDFSAKHFFHFSCEVSWFIERNSQSLEVLINLLKKMECYDKIEGFRFLKSICLGTVRQN